MAEDTVCVHYCTDGRWAELAGGNVELATRVVWYGPRALHGIRDVMLARVIPAATVGGG